ncbi:hypothetical protein KAU33_04515 [Candidatus Dependentiae bacterium]|nr:hypothetical protein [Candidatus Dependentiae bacterium]
MPEGQGRGNFELADIRTGKAIEHQEAANKGKKSKKSKWVDWRNKDTQLLMKIESGYNPFQIEVGNKWYELKGIAFYDSKGVVIQQERGWFGSNNDLNNFPVPETIRRLKLKFDGETFILPKKKDWYERRDPNPHAILYIPIDYFDFEIKEVIENWGSGQKVKIRYYISRTFIQDARQTPLTLSEWIDQPYYTPEGQEVLDEIAELERQLEEKKEKLKRT